MYHRCSHIIVCIFICANVLAQNKLSGKVLDESNNFPLNGASVYFNNTSIGTVTNDKGEFHIPNAISGEIIISSIGYDRMIIKLQTSEFAGKSFTFKLGKKAAMLKDVLILPDATRKRYLKIFIENFLGITEEAARSSITNLSVINFSKAEEHGAFLAYADTPLIILNKKLGYIIRFELVEFYFNGRDGATSFYGFTRYEEMGDKKRWVKNRRDTYYGSTLHFFRSFINNQLEQEHYHIQLVRADSLKQTSASGQIIGYKKIDVGLPTRLADLVKKDSIPGMHVAYWKDRLMVQYLKNPAGKNYLKQKTFLAGNVSVGFRSQLKIISKEIHIDQYGILAEPLNILYSGYWIYEKAANLLPYNYYPDAN